MVDLPSLAFCIVHFPHRPRSTSHARSSAHTLLLSLLCACTPQFAFSVVRFPTIHGERCGVATNWLERLVTPLLNPTKATPAQPASPSKKGGGPQKGKAAASAAAAAGAAGVAGPVRLPVFL